MMKEVDHFSQEECVGMAESASFRFLHFVSSPTEPNRYFPVKWSRIPVMWSTGTEPLAERNGAAILPLEPLALELVGLRANVLPVVVGCVGLTYFLDQTGEVPEAGDRHWRLAVEHRDVFAGTA